MPEFLVPSGYGEAEFVEKRSRFTGRMWLCETEKEAVERIAETRSAYWDATHNVYAYSIRENGVTRYSDDGEPQGTAGLPVLDVFRRVGIQNFLCVVTRYFGGVLLGTGGLVRAYANAAKIALDAAGIAAMKPVTVLSFACPYPLFARVRIEAEQNGGILDHVEYGADIRIRISVPDSHVELFQMRMTELSSGTIQTDTVEKKHIPVRVTITD